jgi:hypothetical protein
MSWITEEEVQELKLKHKIRGLKVYYGFTKITAKIVTKRELIVLYENTNNYEYNEMFLKRQHIVYSRNQTQDEIDDAYWGNRSFTKYSYLIDDNKWRGDIHKILYQNFKADENHASEKMRMEIWKKLYKKYVELWGVPDQCFQLQLEF